MKDLADCWTRDETRATIALHLMEAMIAVVGNLLAGLGVISLFTATLRITRGK
jgi:hypothetical protein